MIAGMPAARLLSFFLATSGAVWAAAPVKDVRADRPTAGNDARDIVIARRNLMAAIGRNMDGITGMVEPGGKVDAADAAEHADEIAVMLMAFPHLFPAASNNWSRRREREDPAGVTEAAPAVWKDPARFRALAMAASQLATEASRAHDEVQFRVLAAALQVACDGCHARFRREEKPYEIPIAPRK